ncbi:MAG: CinA family protein [Pseudomonadota bacterium]
MSAAALTACRARGDTIATAESCTGGMIAAALTDPAGASDVVLCGFVTYSNAAKRDLLGVSEVTLDTFGAVSEEVAAEMVAGARQRGLATLAISVTGIAGPGGSDFKPEGRVCFGLSHGDTSTVTTTVEFGAQGRENVRRTATEFALRALRDAGFPTSQ